MNPEGVTLFIPEPEVWDGMMTRGAWSIVNYFFPEPLMPMLSEMMLEYSPVPPAPKPARA